MMVEKQIDSDIEKIGRYNVLKKIGDGGMGSVFLAIDPKIHRKVAIKLFKIEKLKQDKESLKRFYLEAEAIGKLSHPNIVTIFDIQDEKDEPYLVMEYLEGETLSNIIHQKKQLPIPLIIDIAIQLCDALHYAHSNGIIHRDIKPGNIILLSNNKVKLTDFGIAKFQSLADAPQVTKTGIIIGTPSYMSPEQISGNPIDHRSDIFSLAVVIWELLTGQRAFDADSIATIAFKVVYEELPPADKYNPNVPKELSRVLMKALAKKPDKRYSSIQEFRNDLENLRNTDFTLQFKSIDVVEKVWYSKPINIAIIIFIMIIISMISYYFIIRGSEVENFDNIKLKSVVDYIEYTNNLLQNNRIDEAIEVLQKGKAENPKSIKIKKELAVVKEKKGDYQGAIEEYVDLAIEFPSEINYILKIAENWYKEDKKELAEKLVNQLKVKYPNNQDLNRFMIMIEDDKKKQEEILAKQKEQRTKRSSEKTEEKFISKMPEEKKIDTPQAQLGKGLYGFVNIRCYPSAEVYINRILVGKCPLINHRLPVGKHTIMLKGYGNEIYEKSIFIFSGKTEEFYYNFESYAKIFVQCSDKNYKVYIDNNYMGLTPYYNDKIKSGKHTIIIEKASGQREVKYVFLKPNTMETIQCSSP